MNETDQQGQWRPLSNETDLTELMDLFNGFHDSCVREVHVLSGHYVNDDYWMTVGWETTVRMFVQRQVPNPSAIELRFDQVVGLRLTPPPPNYDAIIFHATFFIRDGVFYWADTAEWTPESAERGDSTWVSARKACWRDASNWMGPELRYLSIE